MTFKSKLLGRRAAARAKEDCSTCTDTEAEEPNAFENFLNDASSVVGNIFSDAASMADDDASEDCSTNTDTPETCTRAGEPKLTFKSKLLGRRATCTDSPDPEACNDTSDGEPSAIEKFLNNASSAVATALREATSMADDMHTIITTDTDTEERLEEAHDEEQNTVKPAKNTIKVIGNPATATLAQPTKETSACETREDEANARQSTSSSMEVKGSPATLAKLMMKLDKKEKQIEKLKRQLNKTELEVVETKMTIRALAAKFRGVLNGDDQSYDDQTEYDESVWDDEERDNDASGLALWYTPSQLSALEKA
eukprot:scaffold36687_cov150-Skeletonema_dohrnii-CCMP3373.AAC.1